MKYFGLQRRELPVNETLKPKSCVLNSALWTQTLNATPNEARGCDWTEGGSTPKTSSPRPQTPHPAPHTSHPTPHTPDLTPHTPHPTPRTPNPKPPNPKPQTPNPKLQTAHQAGGERTPGDGSGCFTDFSESRFITDFSDGCESPFRERRDVWQLSPARFAGHEPYDKISIYSFENCPSILIENCPSFSSGSPQDPAVGKC